MFPCNIDHFASSPMRYGIRFMHKWNQFKHKLPGLMHKLGMKEKTR